MCDLEETNKWKKYYEDKGYKVVLVDMLNNKNIKVIFNIVETSTSDTIFKVFCRVYKLISSIIRQLNNKLFVLRAYFDRYLFCLIGMVIKHTV